MRNAWNRSGLGGSEAFAYGGVAAAIAFIFALTFGVLDAPTGGGHARPDTSTLVAESSP